VGVPEVDDVLRLGDVEPDEKPGPVGPERRLQFPEPLDTLAVGASIMPEHPVPRRRVPSANHGREN